MNLRTLFIFTSYALSAAFLVIFGQNCSQSATDSRVNSQSFLPEEDTIVQGFPIENFEVDLPVGRSTENASLQDCEDESRESMRFSLNFSSPVMGCRFGQDGNLAVAPGNIFRARNEQIQAVVLPEGAVLCSAALNHTDNPNYIYKDELFVTLNENLLLASYDLSDRFAANDDFLRFEWTDFRGEPWENSNAARLVDYCVGQAEGMSSCSIPDRGAGGPLRFSIDSSIILEAMNSSNDNNHKISVITTGDNEAEDCMQNGMTLELDVSYVVPN